MTERGYTKRLVKLFNTVPGCVCRALPDSGARGHKKPYDFFIIYDGLHISIEAKLGNGKLEEHQRKALQEDSAAGAQCFIVRYITSHVMITTQKDFFPCGQTVSWSHIKNNTKEILDWMVVQ